jgi:hypothetical protein
MGSREGTSRYRERGPKDSLYDDFSSERHKEIRPRALSPNNKILSREEKLRESRAAVGDHRNENENITSHSHSFEFFFVVDRFHLRSQLQSLLTRHTS